MLNGIIVPLPQELRTLTRKTLPYDACHFLNDCWIVTLSGVGAAAAHAAAHHLLERDVERLISWGTAAALDQRLEQGALLLPEMVLDKEGRRYPCDPFVEKLLTGKLSNKYFISKALLYGAAPLLKSPAEKAVLFASSGAVAADMESAAVAVVAREAKLPFAVVRAISDDASTALPPIVWQVMDERGEVNVTSLLAALMRKPTAILPLLKLGLGFYQARKGLAAAADVLLQEG